MCIHGVTGCVYPTCDPDPYRPQKSSVTWNCRCWHAAAENSGHAFHGRNPFTSYLRIRFRPFLDSARTTRHRSMGRFTEICS